jgi:oxygen-independent coproporphyrinogen-3 oxidase
MSIAATRRGASRLAPRFGIYVHIPFCTLRCPYCDFNTYVGLDALAPAYLDALEVEARAWVERCGTFPAAGSVFFGGGTPTLVDARLLALLLDRLRAIFAVAEDAEITVEANPETVEASALSILRSAGVNRISIGAQSFRPGVLAALGRTHSTGRTREAVREAREAGFANLNLDLIYGTPGESPDDWAATLDDALALEPSHVSAYALTIEPATAFGAAVAAGRMPAPDDDDQAAKYETALDALEPLGHYEISNWGEPSRHNLIYWTGGEYVGLGAGAHSYVGGVRSWNVKRPAVYIERAASAVAGDERLDPGARAEEWVQLRLRLIEGLDVREAEEVLGRRLGAEVRLLDQAGLVRVEEGHLTLTRRGLLLESEVALRLCANDAALTRA